MVKQPKAKITMLEHSAQIQLILTPVGIAARYMSKMPYSKSQSKYQQIPSQQRQISYISNECQSQ